MCCQMDMETYASGCFYEIVLAFTFYGNNQSFFACYRVIVTAYLIYEGSLNIALEPAIDVLHPVVAYALMHKTDI